MAHHDIELQKSFAANRAAIDAARSHDRDNCPCAECKNRHWQDARDDEFDARWNARMEP